MLGTVCIYQGQVAIVVADTVYEANDQGAVALFDPKGRPHPDGRPRATGQVRVVVLGPGVPVDPAELEPLEPAAPAAAAPSSPAAPVTP